MERMPGPSTAQLLEACSVLFGGNVMCSVGFLRCIRASGIKSAYRRRLLEIHPDRALVVGEPPGQLHDRTVELQQAYSILKEALHDGRLLVPDDDPGEVAPPYSPPPPRPQGLFHRGTLPQRPLRFGEYLYYRGLISWESLIQAICRQRRERPMLGELAVRLDLLAHEDVRLIRASQDPGEKFGEAAVRLGLLAPGKVFVLLGRQRRMGRLFGEYVAETGALTVHQLARLVEEHRLHNRRHHR